MPGQLHAGACSGPHRGILQGSHRERDVPSCCVARPADDVSRRQCAGRPTGLVTARRFDRNDASDGPSQRKTDPALVWDVVVSGTEARIGAATIRYNVGLYNLLDWRYSVPVSPEFRQTVLVQNGRTFLFNLSATF